MEEREWKPAQVNTDLAKDFRQIVTDGWANLSDGNVEAPTGHFALIHIVPAELKELLEAVFPDLEGPVIYPGSYILEEDSDGNATLTEFLTLDRALAAYNRKAAEFAIWDALCPNCDSGGPHERPSHLPGNVHQCGACYHLWDPTEGSAARREDMPLDAKFKQPEPEKLYLVCNGCGEAFDEIATAHDHDCENTPGGDYPSYLTAPESEAM